MATIIPNRFYDLQSLKIECVNYACSSHIYVWISNLKLTSHVIVGV